ncbi:hypothetical protein N7476_000308 [Penicillium atrosanguineum]|uniref:Uncharacterized protein n=1 Tax=Penicillium atrosanguineum TaxID=1132637 RepID=A0A9W9QBE4_9EURO|nr:hypothetical protein N7476_000308 [Penicillium atrosanguineum]
MALNTTSAMIRTRLTVLFLTIAWLALAGLSSAISHFANILQDRAKSDLANATDSILDITFENLMKNVLEGMVVVALLSALFAIFGIILVIYPSWLQESYESGMYYGCIQFLLSLVVVCMGSYFASHLHGYQTSFEYFDRADQFPYYKIMYYGPVGEAAFGSLVFIITLAWVFVPEWARSLAKGPSRPKSQRGLSKCFSRLGLREGMKQEAFEENRSKFPDDSNMIL